MLLDTSKGVHIQHSWRLW